MQTEAAHCIKQRRISAEAVSSGALTSELDRLAEAVPEVTVK